MSALWLVCTFVVFAIFLMVATMVCASPDGLLLLPEGI
jgi:hypothetical protein